MTYDLKLPFDPSFRHTVLLCDCVSDVYYYVLVWLSQIKWRTIIETWITLEPLGGIGGAFRGGHRPISWWSPEQD